MQRHRLHDAPGPIRLSDHAKGVIRQETIVAGSVCDTLELKFTAKRS